MFGIVELDCVIKYGFVPQAYLLWTVRQPELQPAFLQEAGQGL